MATKLPAKDVVIIGLGWTGAILAHELAYCAAQDEVVVFNFETGECLGALIHLPRLNGQALMFFP
jgi:hypothetical protein